MSGRSTREVWKAIQRKVGADADGLPGARTANAIAAHVGVAGVAEEASWPRDSNETLIAFYGEPGSGQKRLHLPYAMRLDWDAGTVLSSFFCHEKVHEPLGEIFTKTLELYGQDRVTELGLDRFGGCLNVRKKRGGSSWSVHAFGAAVDLWPSANRLRWGRERAVFAKLEYDPFWEIVEKAGAVSLGRARNFDWMHFQFARV